MVEHIFMFSADNKKQTKNDSKKQDFEFSIIQFLENNGRRKKQREHASNNRPRQRN